MTQINLKNENIRHSDLNLANHSWNIQLCLYMHKCKCNLSCYSYINDMIFVMYQSNKQCVQFRSSLPPSWWRILGAHLIWRQHSVPNFKGWNVRNIYQKNWNFIDTTGKTHSISVTRTFHIEAVLSFQV